jgi:glycine betaine/proline transport system substrate-binding protein
LPNHAQLLSAVEGDVVQLGDWYQGQTGFGIAMPSYMTDVTSIGDLNQSNVDQIYGIEPGSVIKTEKKARIPWLKALRDGALRGGVISRFFGFTSV